MKLGICLLFLIVSFLFAEKRAFPSEHTIPESKCPSVIDLLQDSSSICADPTNSVSPKIPDGSLQLLLPQQSNTIDLENTLLKADDSVNKPKAPERKSIIYFFWGKGCPHCEEEKIFLDDLKRAHPSLEIRDYEVWYHKENAALMTHMFRERGVHSSGVPVTFIHDRLFSGFTADIKASIKEVLEECLLVSCGDPAKWLNDTDNSVKYAPPPPNDAKTTSDSGESGKETSVTIPFLGVLDKSTYSLPVLTMVIAGMDSFNPCAFFVLLSLLGLLIHARSRNKMLLIGGIFVFFSCFIYFLFMAAWLNLFLFMGQVAFITKVAGGVSLVIAVINIKDFFLFKRGPSLSIPDSAKPKLFDRMRRVLRSDSLVSIMVGATVLAVVANFYELLCTAGFPMIFTRILTLSNLSTPSYYLYLLLYNVIYIIPLLTIILCFTLTLGKHQLSEWQGRFLKLVSGAMMLGLGAVLLVNPALLNSVAVSVVIMLSAVAISLLVATVTRRSGDN